MEPKKTVFPSRIDIWRSYRDEISKEASSISVTEGKKIQKIKREIKTIDPSILEAMNLDMNISKGIGADINFRDKYSKLLFTMDGVDNRLLEDLNKAVSEANALKEQDFVITKDYELVDLQLPRDVRAKQTFKELDSQLAELSNSVQFFPTKAQESLYVLNESINLAKSKVDPIAAEEKVSIAKIDATKDMKWVYFISFGATLLALLVIIIMVILIIVLW